MQSVANYKILFQNIVALIASLCLNTPRDFDAIIRPNIREVFDRFKELQAVSASEVIEEGNLKVIDLAD